jgi:hypothetical protein
MIWPWNVCLPLALVISTLLLTFAFYRVTTWVSRILAAFLVPPALAFLFAFLVALVSGDGYSATFFFGYTAIWAYLGVPVGAILSWLIRSIF